MLFTDSKYWTYQFSNRASGKKAWVTHTSKPLRHVAKEKYQVHAYAGISYYGKTSLIFVTGTTGHYNSSRTPGSKGVKSGEYCNILRT